MRGLNRTAPLAFGHPGLGTTAVRANGRLTIQNDIGTTDAHVLVIHVEDKAVAITYTDNHRPRAKFFISLFEGQGVAWSPFAEENAAGLSVDVFYLLTGRYVSDDATAIEGFLEFLGSRIVFLIDWNKARKTLQTFVGDNNAIRLLTWAAAHDFGHRAFLELGGADLILEAVDRAAAGRIPYGVRLDEALGAPECVKFLEHVLRDTSQGLSAGRTARLIRDEIQADLSRRFETAESSFSPWSSVILACRGVSPERSPTFSRHPARLPWRNDARSRIGPSRSRRKRIGSRFPRAKSRPVSAKPACYDR